MTAMYGKMSATGCLLLLLNVATNVVGCLVCSRGSVYTCDQLHEQTAALRLMSCRQHSVTAVRVKTA
jgi:hypothetical protein